MKTEYRFIYFEEKPLFEVYWLVKHISDKSLLGSIRFYPEWDDYVFEGRPNVVFSSVCLIDIVDFLNQLKKEKETEELKRKDPPIHGKV